MLRLQTEYHLLMFTVIKEGRIPYGGSAFFLDTLNKHSRTKPVSQANK